MRKQGTHRSACPFLPGSLLATRSASEAFEASAVQVARLSDPTASSLKKMADGVDIDLYADDLEEGFGQVCC